jgi:hypothetical protein
MPVDREQKVIRGFKVMSLGDALGHGMAVDETTLSQLEAIGNKSAVGIKTRVQHSNGKGDGFGRYLGKSRNFSRQGDSVFADLHLDELAFKSPEGDWGSYLLDLAERAPDSFGSSPEVIQTKQPVGKGGFAMRIQDLLAIAIVDRPATNVGFFSTPVGESNMAEVTALEAQVAELSAERDTATKQAAEYKLRIDSLETKIKEAAAAEVAELSAAKTEAIAATLKSERARIGDVLALCSKANKTDLAAKFIADGTPVTEVQSALFSALCAGAKPVGEGSGELHLSGSDENAKYKAEFTALSAKDKAAFGDEAGYVAMRRVDDGLDQLTTKAA